MRYFDSQDDEKDKKPDRWVWVKDQAEMSGKSISKAFEDIDSGATHHKIIIALHDEYAEKMRALSKANLKKPLAIVLDGEVLSAPTIQSELGAHFEITGNFTKQQARDLSTQLMNPLETPLKVEKTTLIPPPGAPQKP
jgi:preprotein translocase subunit SecD